MLQLFGPADRALGSVTLRGVPYASVADADVDVVLRRLLGGSGYVDPAIPNPAPVSQILFLTTDGIHDGLMASVVH